MSRPVLALLLEIDDNIGFILDVVRGRTASHLANDRMLRYAVQHALMVTSAAMVELSPGVRKHHPHACWELIAASTDATVAEANQSAPERLWILVHDQLPGFQRVIRKALHQAREGVLPVL